MSSNSKHNTHNRNASKPSSPDPIVEIAKINQRGAVINAILALFGILVTALLAPVALEYVRHTLSAPPTPIVAITETITPIAVATDTPRIESTLTIPPTPENAIIPFTPTPTFTPTIPTPTHTSTLTSVVPGFTSAQSPSDTMTVVLSANASQGKAPIAISFNAKDSYVQFADGTIIVCGNMHVCNYSWTVFRENKVVNTTTNNTGSFSYNFTGRGTYLVTVYACRGEACSGSGATISIR